MHFRTRGQKIFNVFNYIIVTAVALSCLLPIRRAVAIDPALVLKGE